jgi:hypothetical protein
VKKWVTIIYACKMQLSSFITITAAIVLGFAHDFASAEIISVSPIGERSFRRNVITENTGFSATYRYAGNAVSDSSPTTVWRYQSLYALPKFEPGEMTSAVLTFTTFSRQVGYGDLALYGTGTAG